ncbi:MAG: LysM peptidoglycan-binding domain-containing protein [Kineosporiaceae bacterium]|nr:LysM peptidoglycan-binding domain-containing protein [Aeromicrobium sp.]
MRLSSTGYGVAAVSAFSLLTLGPGSAAAARDLNDLDFNRSLVAAVTLLLVALSTWSLACMTLTFAADRTAAIDVLAHLITPSFLRRALFLGAAGALAIGPAAGVSDTGRGAEAPERSVTSRSLDGLRLPDRPLGGEAAAASVAAARHLLVQVNRGDTLWSIASRHLGSEASPSEISVAVEGWYGANRALIGPEPDLIFPGQQLTQPAKESP